MKKSSEKIYRTLRSRVANNLARLRAEQGLTFKALGERSGLHWRHLQKIEAGEVNLTLATVACLVDGLGVEVSELVRSTRAQ